MDRQSDRQRQTDRQTDRQTKTDRQTGRQTVNFTHIYGIFTIYLHSSSGYVPGLNSVVSSPCIQSSGLLGGDARGERVREGVRVKAATMVTDHVIV